MGAAAIRPDNAGKKNRRAHPTSGPMALGAFPLAPAQHWPPARYFPLGVAVASAAGLCRLPRRYRRARIEP